jgi:reactive chlorine resistance protein C
MENPLRNEERLHARATLLVKIGTAVLRYGTVIILLLFGAQKWTPEDAAGIQAFTTNSPLFSWMYHLTSSQHASEVIGVVELVIAGLIVVRHWFPTLSGIGSVAGSVMFLVTLSFLITTPKLSAADQGFLIKDLFLLGGCILTAGEALLEGQVIRGRVIPITSDLPTPY